METAGEILTMNRQVFPKEETATVFADSKESGIIRKIAKSNPSCIYIDKKPRKIQTIFYKCYNSRVKKLPPSLYIAISFFLIILLGGIVLSLPISSSSGQPTNFLDAVFTANSATCVTGLVTLDTGTHFSLFGQCVLMFLMQIGGLGYVTVSVFLALLLGRKIFVSDRIMLQEAINAYSNRGVVNTILRIALIVFIMEGLGALILFVRWIPDLGVAKSLFFAVFHSISAFNNAGFSNFPNNANLTAYVTDWTVNLTITTLIIVGGLGFITISNIIDRRRWTLTTNTVVFTTIILLVLGTLAFAALEWNNPNTLGPLSTTHKFLASYFQAVTPRTAGFNTLDFGKMASPTLLITILLMFIGASPGGTGGGVKTSTFAIIMKTIRDTLRGSRDTNMFGRRIPPEIVRKAFTITILSLGLVMLGFFVLTETERFSSMQILFEIVSAFGTVGLSIGITPMLSPIGKIVIIIIMFAGRVGPLSLLIALSLRQRSAIIEFPKENVSIG
jgi:trk system potassium uptake protein TrkH